MLRLQGVKNQSSLRRENFSYHEQVRENGACARSNGCHWYGGASLCGNDGYGNRGFVYVWDHGDRHDDDRYRDNNRHNDWGNRYDRHDDWSNRYDRYGYWHDYRHDRD